MSVRTASEATAVQVIRKHLFPPAFLSPLARAGRVECAVITHRTSKNVGDWCALIMNAFRTLIRFSAHSHKEAPIRSLGVSFVAVCGETLQKCPLQVIRQGAVRRPEVSQNSTLAICRCHGADALIRSPNEWR
jgi:hypothetical protein